MTIEECYGQINGNYQEAVGRLMNDRLVIRFALKFINDPSMQQLREAVSLGDIPLSFRAAHTLKGVAANLAFTELHARTSELTEQLRPQTEVADPILFKAVEDCYSQTIDKLKAFEAQA